VAEKLLFGVGRRHQLAGRQATAAAFDGLPQAGDVVGIDGDALASPGHADVELLP